MKLPALPELIGDAYAVLLAAAGLAGIAAGVYAAFATGHLWFLAILVVPALGLVVWRTSY